MFDKTYVAIGYTTGVLLLSVLDISYLRIDNLISRAKVQKLFIYVYKCLLRIELFILFMYLYTTYAHYRYLKRINTMQMV